MSLLDAAPETVTVSPQETYIDARGDERVRPAPTGVSVRAWMQPMSTLRLFPSVDATQQQRVYASWRLIARAAPLGVWSRVEWRGQSFSVRSGPEERRYSGATSHITALLQEER